MWELMIKGGWIMWPIMISSVAAAALFLERVFHLHRAQIKQEDFLSGIYTIVNRGNIEQPLGGVVAPVQNHVFNGVAEVVG